MTMAVKNSHLWCVVLAAIGIGVGCSSPDKGTLTNPRELTATAKQAFTSPNGLWQNGLSTNGLWQNGLWQNGLWQNGLWQNGLWQNGLWQNGLWQNGLWQNGLWQNGLWQNGLWQNGLWSNALWRNGLGDAGVAEPGSPAGTLQSSASLRQLLQYIYACAMPPAVTPPDGGPPIAYDTTIDPNNGTLKCAPPDVGGEEAGADGGAACDVGYTCSSQGTCVVPLTGLVGLAINADGSTWWGQPAPPGAAPDGGAGNAGNCDESCQRWVSACVLARTNAYGVHVEISMRAPNNAPQAIKNALATTSNELATYTLREGAYYGNIFETTPTPVVCSGPSSSCADAGPPSANCYTQCAPSGPPTAAPDGGAYTGPATGPIASTPSFYACAGPESNVPEITKRFCSSQGDQVIINVPGVCVPTATELGTCDGIDETGSIYSCYASTDARSAAEPDAGDAGPVTNPEAHYDEVVTVYLQQPIAVCGNGVCETYAEADGGVGGENATNCPSDCHPGTWVQDFTTPLNSASGAWNPGAFYFGALGAIKAVGPDEVVVAGINNNNLGGPGSMAVAKYSTSGSLVWSLSFGDSTFLDVSGVAVEPSGNIIVTGPSAGDGGSVPIWAATLVVSDAGVPSLSSIVTLPIGAGLTGFNFAMTSGVAVDSQSNVVVTGLYSGGNPFATDSCGGNNTQGLFLLKFSPTGNVIWAECQTQNQGAAPPLALAADADNIVLVTPPQGIGGTLQKLCSDGTSDPNTPCSDGSFPWTQTGGPTATYSAAAVDATGNVYASGYFASGQDFGAGPVSVIGLPPFLEKYGPNGNLLWANYANIVCPPGTASCGGALTQPEPNRQEVFGIGMGFDPLGNVVLAAYGDPAIGGGINFSGAIRPVNALPTFPTYGASNLFLAAYAPDGGRALWAKQVPIILQSQSVSVALDPQGRVVLSGNFSGSMEVDDQLLVTPIPEDPNTLNSFVASFDGPSPLDTTPPVIGVSVDQTGASINTVPNTITSQATSSCGAQVFFMPPTAVDNGNPDAGAPPPGATVACSPPPNTIFSIGTTPVTCTASDPFGHSSSATFQVVVQDTVGPVFSLADIQASATSASGATVTYAPTATDQVDCSTGANDSPPCTPTLVRCITNVQCTPPSGSVFAIGNTPVTCTAMDSAHNTSKTKFSVIVTPASGCTTCAARGANCGTISDNCGNTLNCGVCTAPQTCGGGGTANECGCKPVSTCPAGDNCGTIPNGCGGTLSCGACTAPQTCGGSGKANECGCTPVTTCPAGDNCGTISNGCGGTISCGSCTAPQTCGGSGKANECGCTPTTCSAQKATCGTISNGCGGTLNCGPPCGPTLASFALYATEAIEMDSGASVTGCNVGVENTTGPFLGGGVPAYLNSGAKIQSTETLYASSVFLSSGSSVGPIDTNHLTGSSGATHGAVSAFPTMPVPPAAPSAKAGTTSVTLSAGTSKTLASGAYGAVTVNSNATLTLTGGTYVFSSLNLNSGATLVVKAATLLSVTGAAGFSSGSFLGPASGSGLTAKSLAVYFDASSAVSISAGAKIRALFFAPNALVNLSASSFTGAIEAAQVIMNASATITCEDGLAPVL